MDAVDVRIFVDIAFKDPSFRESAERQASPSIIGKRLKLDEKTVRLRVKKMEDEGFIKYYQAVPNLALFGLNHVGLFRFEAHNLTTKLRALQYVHHLPGVVEASDYLGPSISTRLSGASTEEVQRLADETTKRFELHRLSLGDRDLRPPLYQPDTLDWKIVQKLRYDAHCSIKDVADAFSITPRMAQYRITKLLKSGELMVRAVIDTQKQGGLVFYELEISVDEMKESRVVRQLREGYEERLWSTQTSKGMVLANLFGFTLGEPEEVAVRVMGMEGVGRCVLFILKEVIEPRRPNWIDDLIEKKTSSAG